MSPYVLLPVVVLIGIGTVIGIRAYYTRAKEKEGKTNQVETYAENIEEHTRSLENAKR